MKTLFTRALAALLGGVPALVAVAAEAPRRFAAPEVASAPAASGASGILLRATAQRKTVWTADGRRHERSTPSLALAEVRQLRVRRASARF